MFVRQVLSAALLSLLASPSVAAILKESIARVPEGWHAGKLAGHELISLQIALTESNADRHEEFLMDVADPDSKNYGKYHDRDDLDALFAPSKEARSAVTSWLEAAGVKHIHNEAEFVNFAAPVDKVNELLSTTFKRYHSGETSKVRTTEYSVPEEIAHHIELIHPTTYFGRTKGRTAYATTNALVERAPASETGAAVDPECSEAITPACVKELYNVGTYAPSASSGSKIAFGSFLNQSAVTNDLTVYEVENQIPMQGFAIKLINGGVNNQSPANESTYDEADLDAQNIVGVSHPLPLTEYITGGSPPFIPNLDEPTVNENEPYMPYYTYLLKQKNSALPQVISNSYGDDEQTVPIAYAKKVCNQIAKMGMRGISVLESSGDTGIGAPCQSNDGKKTPQFTPEFPGTCPYVTAVGGTQAVSPEVAWTGSSGGFSNYFAQPSYQAAKVATYFSKYITPATLKYYQPYFNQSGRGFPDVAAHSLTPDYLVIYGGAPMPSGGTSAASPVVAGIIGMLNDARLRAKKPALGFLNPWLYKSGYKSLNDITGGGSTGCNGVNGQSGATIPGASVIPYASWNATVGWDPVTGLGTPNFQKLKTAVLKLK